MFIEDKVTEIFCMADDFCKFFDAMMAKYTIKAPKKRQYHRDGTLSKAEVMLIMILFHGSGYRCLKHFYLEHVTKHLRHLFPAWCPITASLSWRGRSPFPWRCSSRRYFWANARASASLTAPRSGFARISASIFTGRSRA